MSLKHISLNYIIPLYIDNIDNNSLNERLNKYASYGPEVMDKIHFILVDDCSPVPIKIKNTNINYTLVRITDNIKWNQGGARNLGATLATSSKVILTDLDIQFPKSLLIKLINHSIPKEIFQFKRTYNGQTINPHPNTFFCSKNTFFKSLGVDEEFCGNYGYEDIYFLNLQKHLKTKVKLFRKESIIALSSKIEAHNLIRDVSINETLLHKKNLAIQKKAPFSEHSRMFLNFNWIKVSNNFIN